MRRAVIVFALLAAPSPVAASEFVVVMNRAQHSEGALEPQQMVTLVEAQGSAMKPALTQCTSGNSAIPDRFAVVLRVDAEGRAVAAWMKHASEFEECFAAAMRESFHYEPPRTPFYTAIEYEHRRLQGEEGDRADD